MIKSFIVAAAFVLATSQGGVAQDTARMEQVIQSYVTAGTFMGAVLVARDGAIVHNKAYGLANVEWDVPNTPTTKFRLGSITKQFTAASILLLEERGKLKIDAPVKTYLPDSPVSWEKITVFNLLTHTSGIPNFTALPEYGAAKLKATGVDATIATFRDRPLDFAPGERMSYSNSGYLVLGSIIEKVAGQSYEKFVVENLFTPLGMKDSGYDSNTALIKRRASGYSRVPAGLLNATYIHMSVPHAAGALYSTTEDLLKWEQGLFGAKVVSRASLDRMTTPFQNNYAFGLTSTTANGRRVVAHGGGIDGFNTQMAYYPESRTVVIVLSNVAGPVPDMLGRQLAALMHGEPVTLPSERKEITLPGETLAKYVGIYDLVPKVTITVTLDGGRLFAQLTGQGRNEIFAQSQTLFFLKVVDAQLEFAPDGSSAVLHQNGRTQKAIRR